jgi:hypothetical protein
MEEDKEFFWDVLRDKERRLEIDSDEHDNKNKQIAKNTDPPFIRVLSIFFLKSDQ